MLGVFLGSPRLRVAPTSMPAPKPTTAAATIAIMYNVLGSGAGGGGGGGAPAAAAAGGAAAPKEEKKEEHCNEKETESRSI